PSAALGGPHSRAEAGIPWEAQAGSDLCDAMGIHPGSALCDVMGIHPGSALCGPMAGSRR
ncbi:unnamed protein product, partial [Coccothraustes coccothraustes]